MTHRLTGAQFYLAGPMDDVKDRGSGWRKEMTSFLHSMAIGVLCPYNKPIGISEDEDYFNKINTLKSQGKFQDAHNLMKKIVADDYRMVDKADALILYVDKEAHMCGSYHESALAAYQRKPVIVVCKQGKEHIPNWLFGICKHEMFFSSLHEAKLYITHICLDGDVDDLNRWRFFDFKKVYGVSRNV